MDGFQEIGPSGKRRFKFNANKQILKALEFELAVKCANCHNAYECGKVALTKEQLINRIKFLHNSGGREALAEFQKKYNKHEHFHHDLKNTIFFDKNLYTYKYIYINI